MNPCIRARVETRCVPPGKNFIFLLGILDSPEDFDSNEELYDAVGGVLLEVGGDNGEEQVRELCERLYVVLKG